MVRAFLPKQRPMETAGIEPASSVAKRSASTGIAGALISPLRVRAGGPIRGASLLVCPRAAEANRLGRARC
jgi:hypothetical protein